MNVQNNFKLTTHSIDVFTKGKYQAFYFAMHSFVYLREHKTLLEKPDYCRLYEELLEFLIEGAVERCAWQKSDASNRADMEYLVDVFSNRSSTEFERFSDDLIKKFLGYRRLIWALEETSGLCEQ